MIWAAWRIVMGGISIAYRSGVEGENEVIYNSNTGIFL